MKIGEIDYDLKLPKRSLFLCKPNKSIIAKINEAYDIQYYTKLSTVNELSFKIPTIIIKDDVPMDNPNIERIKHRYIFKYVVGGLTEYFLVNESSKVYGDEDYIEYRALSLAVLLSDKNIREFEHYGDLYEVTKALLDGVYESQDKAPIERWKVLPQDVDSYFTTSDQADRKYTVGSMTLLEAIYDVAEKWNAVIIWDTVNLSISFKKAENVGLNKGFYIRDGKYLENFDLQIDTSSTITRLRAFGSEKLTFRELSPTGENYIQDFSFYMYPFEYDEATGTVLKHSDYMSDELCIAIIKFNKKVESLQGAFEIIYNKIVTLNGILTDEQQILDEIVSQRIALEDERDLLLAEFEPDKEFWGKNGWNAWGKKDGTPPHTDVLARLRAKEHEERMQQIAVDNAKFNVQDAETEKANHLAKLHHTNNFTIAEWSELQQFVIEKEYNNDSITQPELLLKEAELVFKQNQEPAIKLSLSIIDFLSVVECQNDWDKLGLGDSIRIRYDRLKVNILAKIIEINYNFEDFTISLTIANEKDLKDGSEQLMDLLNKADITSTIVSLDRDGWNLSKENNGLINDIINSKWDSLKQAVLAGYDQQITINERGIIVKSLDDPMSWLVIQNGFLAITNDNGNTWKHAISKDGIWGEYIFGKVISGVNLFIEDESGAWKTQGARTTIYKARTKNPDGTWSDPEETMWLGLVSDNARDEFDNVIRQDSGECFGLKSWNDVTMVELTNCLGFAISRWGNKYTPDGNYGWEKVLWADTNGTLWALDLVAQNLKIRNNVGELMLDAEENYFNIGLFEDIVADGKLTTLEKLQLITELHKIHRNYKQLLSQAEKYIRSARDNGTDIDGAFNTDTQKFETDFSTKDRFSTSPLQQAYLDLMNYMSQYIKILDNGYGALPLDIDVDDELTESTSEVADRGVFISKFRTYHEEAQKLAQAIEDSIFYSSIHMGEYYNNLVMNEFGFIAVRNDGKYRAYLNATNGLALERWENGHWVKKLYASIGNDEYPDGTLIAEELVAKKLRIETKHNEVLLDMDSLNIDFSVLNSIILDDVIVSVEKESLIAEWNSIEGQHDEIMIMLDSYINNVYSDRESTYAGLDQARDVLIDAKNNLTENFNALKATLDIVFADMTTNTYLSTDLNLDRDGFVALYKNLYTAFEYARNSIKNFLEKSSLQLGRNYNNTVIDALEGVTVYRGDMKTRAQMNATKGFSISRNDGTYDNPIWVDLFYVTTDGDLYAQDIYAKNITTKELSVIDGKIGEAITLDEGICEGIKVKGLNGEEVTLNGCVGLKIDVNGDNRVWIGTDGNIYAKKLYIQGDDEMIVDVDGSYISDLTVNSLKTLGVGGGQQDIVHIQDNFLRFNTWMGGTEKTKFELTYEGSGETSYPVMIFGAGNGNTYENGSEQAKIYKDNEKFAIEYDAPNAKMSRFYFNETDTDDEGQAVYFESKGGVRFHSDNKFVAKTGTHEFFRVVRGEDIKMQFGENSWIAINNTDGLMIRFDTNNYIKINSEGVTVKGTKINLN